AAPLVATRRITGRRESLFLASVAPTRPEPRQGESHEHSSLRRHPRGRNGARHRGPGRGGPPGGRHDPLVRAVREVHPDRIEVEPHHVLDGAEGTRAALAGDRRRLHAAAAGPVSEPAPLATIVWPTGGPPARPSRWGETAAPHLLSRKMCQLPTRRNAQL